MRWIGAVVIAALMLFALQRLVVEPWHCNSEIKRLRTETIGALRTDPATQLALARTILAESEALIQGCNPVAENFMIKAANERALGLNENAAATYRDALQIDRRPEIYANLGDVEMVLGQSDDARRDYFLAARFNPSMLGMISDEGMKESVIHDLAAAGDSRPLRFHRHHRTTLP